MYFLIISMFSYHGYNQQFNYYHDYYYNLLNHHRSSRLGIISFQYIFCYLRGILAYVCSPSPSCSEVRSDQEVAFYRPYRADGERQN